MSDVLCVLVWRGNVHSQWYMEVPGLIILLKAFQQSLASRRTDTNHVAFLDGYVTTKAIPGQPTQLDDASISTVCFFATSLVIGRPTILLRPGR